MSDTKNNKEKNDANQIATNKKFIEMADIFIADANQLCEVKEPEEFTKMLKEHMKQYEVVFDKKPDSKKK